MPCADRAPSRLAAAASPLLVRIGISLRALSRAVVDDVGTVVTHNDELLCSFFNADQIIDFLLSIGMRPFVELSFMPTALASGSKTVFHYRGNVNKAGQWQEVKLQGMKR